MDINSIEFSVQVVVTNIDTSTEELSMSNESLPEIQTLRADIARIDVSDNNSGRKLWFAELGIDAFLADPRFEIVTKCILGPFNG